MPILNRFVHRRVIDRVFIEARLSRDEAQIEAVENAFARWGFNVRAEPEYPLTGGPPVLISWAVVVLLSAPILSFFQALASEAGKDAYAALKAWVKDIVEARRTEKGSGEIRLQDSKGSMLVIPDSISDEGVELLRAIDWRGVNFLVWDSERGQWRDLRDDD
jgi:hypothetical protein